MPIAICASTKKIVDWDGDDISSWKYFTSQMYKESPSVARFSAEELQSRWLKGLACVSVRKGRPIAYTSLIRIPIPNSSLKFHVYESATGWTTEEFRSQKLQQSMQSLLHYSIKNHLIIAFCGS